ncbi:hypothetical protein V6N12_056421 [Hibiscus sabdariffa]|uniref:Uncharacterized protein n=1 Tax=Hibiscus sabdariffa TaxID=183260 RepID=A0ABR2CSG9_9ROSI
MWCFRTSMDPPPKIVNEGETVLKQIELEDPLENVGAKLVRQAGAKMTLLVEDHELAHVAAVSAGNDHAVGKLITDALQQVGRKGVVKIEKGKCIENSLEMVEGMQFDRGHWSDDR